MLKDKVTLFQAHDLIKLPGVTIRPFVQPVKIFLSTVKAYSLAYWPFPPIWYQMC